MSYEKHYEAEFGIQTSSIKKSSDKDNFHYQGASYMALLKVLNELPPELKNKGFVDFGSGKGRALFCAEYMGFNYLTGVELDNDLVLASNNNLATFTKKRKESTVEFINCNALNYVIDKDASTFYFFNPFSEKIMQKVIENIIQFATREKKEVYIVYLNPVYRKLWTDNQFKEYKIIKTNNYTEAVIYFFKPANYQ